MSDGQWRWQRGALRPGKLSRHPDLVDSLYLVRNGVPFDVAFTLPPDERAAWVVVMGQFDGLQFDWRDHSWTAA